MSGAVRCGHCPGASPLIRRLSPLPCASCRGRRPEQPCPDCGGPLVVDLQAEASDGRTCAVAFCMACEFCIEIQP